MSVSPAQGQLLATSRASLDILLTVLELDCSSYLSQNLADGCIMSHDVFYFNPCSSGDGFISGNEYMTHHKVCRPAPWPLFDFTETVRDELGDAGAIQVHKTDTCPSSYQLMSQGECAALANNLNAQFDTIACDSHGYSAYAQGCIMDSTMIYFNPCPAGSWTMTTSLTHNLICKTVN